MRDLSVTDDLERLRKQATPVEPIFGKVGFRGQANVWYAEPNTGKTLLAQAFLMESILSDRVDPSEVYYFNMDDSSQGIVDKIEIADEYRFNVVLPQEKGFHPKELTDWLYKSVENGSAKRCVIVVDTLKKCVDIMSKGDSTVFGTAVRRFIQSGGTALLLAHTNKHKTRDGKLVYAGTADFLQDMDCVYIMSTEESGDKSRKLVNFENIKKRGNAPDRVVYSYSTAADVKYRELVDSVASTDDKELEEARRSKQLELDEPHIGEVKRCIHEGKVIQGELIAEVCKRTRLSVNKALLLLNRYSGEDVNRCFWDFSRSLHGAKTYRLLQSINFNPDHF